MSKPTNEICTRCHMHPRRPSHRWCTECGRTYTEARRMALSTRGELRGIEKMRHAIMSAFEHIADSEMNGRTAVEIIRSIRLG